MKNTTIVLSMPFSPFNSCLRSSQPRPSHPTPEPFLLNFNLFPETAHQFKSEGLYAAYWNSPPSFRSKAYGSFRNLSSGIFRQGVAPEIWECMDKEPKGK